MNGSFLVFLLTGFFCTLGFAANVKPDRHAVVQLAPDGFKPWDPLSSATNSATFNAAVHKQPFYFTREFRVDPGYVKEWEWDFKRNVYLLTLDDKIKFHNGDTIKATDLEFALVKPFLTSLDRWEKANLVAIKGISKIKAGSPFKSGLVEGIKILSPSKLEITLDQPNPVFLYSFSETVPPLGPISSFMEDLYSPKTVPIGCGSYRVTFSDPKTTLVTVQRIGAAASGVPLSIDFYSHGNGIKNKADLAIASGRTLLVENPDYKTYIGDITQSIQVMDFNFTNKFAKVQKYRQAIEMAIDKEAASKGDSFSQVADQLVALSFYGRAEKKANYNPEMAKKILDELPEDFRRSHHKAYYHGPKEKLPIYLTRIKDQLSKVGLDFEFIQTDQHRMEAKDTDIEAHVFGFGLSFVDPLNPFSFYLPNGVSPNHAPKSDKTYVGLYQNALRARDIPTRAAAIAKITEYCRIQICQIQLFEDKPFFLYGKRISTIGEAKLFLTFDFDLIKINEEIVAPAANKSAAK